MNGTPISHFDIEEIARLTLALPDASTQMMPASEPYSLGQVPIYAQLQANPMVSH